MPDLTDNHEFQLWREGETNWEHRTDFQRIDEKLELRGPLGERPADPPDGTKFLVTEGEKAGATFIYDGSSRSWNKLPVDTSTVESDFLEYEGWRWIDVTNHGVDSTGSSDVSQAIEDLAASNRVLVHPGGTYRVDSSITIDTNCKFVGRGGAEYQFGSDGITMFRIGWNEPVTNFLFENFEISDPEGAGNRVFQAVCDGRHIFRDVEITDQMRASERGPFRIDTLEGGVAILERVYATEGSPLGEEGTGALLYPDGPDSVIKLLNCRFAQWPDNAIYGKHGGGESDYGGEGRIVVEGGVYKNSGVACLRTETSDTVFRDARIVIDEDYTMGKTTRPIRLRENDNHRLEGIDVYVSNDEALRFVEVESEAGRFDIDNCTFVAEDTDTAFGLQAPGDSVEKTRCRIRNCDIEVTGTAIGDTFAFLTSRGRDLTIKDCRIHIPDGDTIACRLDTERARCQGCDIVSNGRAVRLEAEHTRVKSNDRLESPTQPVRVSQNTGEVLVADNNMNGGIRDDGNNDVVSRDNFVL